MKANGVGVFVEQHELDSLGTAVTPTTVISGSGSVFANHFALSRRLYSSIPEKHLLFFQEDSVFCLQRQNRTLESFMHHHWLGAPWLVRKHFRAQEGDQLNLFYGNGGLSIRSKSFILDCLDAEQYQEELVVARIGHGLPEDVFFSRCLYERHPHKVALDEAVAFAAEEVLVPGFIPFGLHDPCRVANGAAAVGCATEQNKLLTKELLDACPSAGRILEKCVKECMV